MFTGIIEQTGVVDAVSAEGTNKTFTIRTPLSAELKVDQSVSHSGVCLTVETIGDGFYTVTAIEETLIKTNLASWERGTIVNLERCLRFDGRLDGHIVRGHVDTTAQCISREDKKGSWEYMFRIDPKFAQLIIEKGSISMNGISLTIFNISRDAFRVAIIPYTFEHTNIQQLHIGGFVNIEFDLIGKYVNRMQTVN